MSEIHDIADIEKWVWKMEYCRKHIINPGEWWAWEKAEQEYNKQLEDSGDDRT